ncbi:hypothetical protein ACN27G_29320 [Plantactinospora sp. WMMB334]|uniref:hypothetical protein n=1 Tax=Plantactinospora sp. WMMB334 TaxID=3404119 RepID=UPI003B94C5E9
MLIQLTLLVTLANTAVASVLAAAAFPMASAVCSVDDAALICTAQGQAIAAAAPFYGGLIGTALIGIAAYILPRRYRSVWAAAGVALVLAGWIVGYGVAAGGP